MHATAGPSCPPETVSRIVAPLLVSDLAKPAFPLCCSIGTMSKREARSFAAAGVDVDAPRAKRRKEAPATSSASPERKHDAEAHTATGDAKGDSQDAESVVEDKEEVREKGLQLWQTLKDAVNKECVVVELHFAFDPNVQSFL